MQLLLSITVPVSCLLVIFIPRTFLYYKTFPNLSKFLSSLHNPPQLLPASHVLPYLSGSLVYSPRTLHITLMAFLTLCFDALYREWWYLPRKHLLFMQNIFAICGTSFLNPHEELFLDALTRREKVLRLSEGQIMKRKQSCPHFQHRNLFYRSERFTVYEHCSGLVYASPFPHGVSLCQVSSPKVKKIFWSLSWSVSTQWKWLRKLYCTAHKIGLRFQLFNRFLNSPNKPQMINSSFHVQISAKLEYWLPNGLRGRLRSTLLQTSTAATKILYSMGQGLFTASLTKYLQSKCCLSLCLLPDIL